MRPTVSIVIATYRRDETLRRAISSAVGQTYPLVEVVVVDDNANEAWNNTVRGILSDFPQVRLIVNGENKGSAETRNIGIRASSGEYVTFLDDDDVYLPDKLEKQLEAMLHENADYCITDLYLYNESGKLTDRRIRSYIKSYETADLIRYHLMYHMTGTDSMMFRKSYLLSIGGFPPIDLGDEFYLMCRAIEAAGRFAYSSGCSIKAYVHSGENGLSSGQNKIKCENDLFEYKRSFFGKIGRRSVRYIRMRHYASLAFAYLRLKKYLAFVLNGLKAVLCSPIGALKLLGARH